MNAIADHDRLALQALFSTPVRFRAVTPRRFWDAETSVAVADVVLDTWFDPDKTIKDISWVEAGMVGDLNKISYRLAVDLRSGPSVIEQVAYYTEQDGLITDIRVVCSGFCPSSPI